MGKSTDFSSEVYKHYGLNLMDMKENGEEHDWGICVKDKAKNGWALVRRYMGRTARPARD